jgi:two-component system nitrate/nitrite response regulator NarL
MKIVVLTPVKLLGDGLAFCLQSRADTVEVVNDLAAVRILLEACAVQVMLVDVTQGIDLFDVRDIVLKWPDVPLVALGLTEQKQDVIKCGRAGFAGYVARDATIDGLYTALKDISQGKVACPPEITGGLLRALFRKGPQSEESLVDPVLTRREREVLDLIGQGLSNKEIGTHLCVSVSTVKHHVHTLFEKLGLTRRADAMRRVRDSPWLARTTAAGRR